MATGSGLPAIASRRVLTRPQPLTPGIDPALASSASAWEALSRVGRTISDIGAAEQKRARAAYLAGSEVDIDRAALDLRDKFAFSPDGFDNAWQGYVDGKVQAAEPWAVDHLRNFAQGRGNRAYGSILGERRDRETRNEAATLADRLKVADQDVNSLAMNGGLGTTDFEAATRAYRSILSTQVDTGLLTQERADLLFDDMLSRAAGEDAARRALEVEQEQGAGAGIKFLRENVLENEGAGLSPAQRRAIYRNGQAAIRAWRNENRAEITATTQESRDLRERLKANPSSFDSGEVNSLLDRLRTYGSAGEHHRLAARAAVAEATAPFVSGNIPLNEFAQHIRTMRGEARISPQVRAAISEASEATGLPASWLTRIAGKESRFDPGAQASTSTATGLFQFTDATWRDMLARYGAKHGLGPDTPKTDPRASAILAGELAQENARALRNAGEPVTLASVYLSHFAGAGGAGGAVKLLKADPTAAAADILPEAAKANRSIFYTSDGTPRSVFATIERLTRGLDAPSTAGEDGLAGLPTGGQVAREAQAIFVKQAREFWPFFEDALARGRAPSADDLAAVRYAASISQDPAWAAEVNGALTAAGLAPAMAEQPAAQTRAELDRMQQQAEQAGWGISEMATFQALEDQFARQQKELRENPTAFAVRQLGAKAPAPLNFTSAATLRAGLSERAALARMAANAQGVAVGNPLNDAESASFRAAIAGGDPTSKASLYGALVDALPEDMRAVALADLGAKGPDAMVASWAGALMAEDPSIARSVLAGLEAIKAEPRYDPSKGKPRDWTDTFDKVLPADTFTLPARSSETGAYATIRNAARARYADLSAQAGDTSGEVNEDRLRQAVDDVTGGVLVHNGGRIIAPVRGMQQEDFDALLDGLTDDDLSNAGTLSGARVTADYLRRNARLESLTAGRYLVQIGLDPAAPLYAVEMAMEDEGDLPRPFILDLRGRKPLLAPAEPSFQARAAAWARAKFTEPNLIEDVYRERYRASP